MSESHSGLEQIVSWPALLGYLNFSEGKPDPRFQKQLNDAYGYLAEHGASEPWKFLLRLLTEQLVAVRSSGASAFQDVSQAEAVLALVEQRVLAAYRAHHADLLFHRTENELFQPFFLARVFEAVLAQGPPWNEEDRILRGTLIKLNDFVGHRPIAILETRPRGEPYPHERVRPIPLYLRGAGVAWGSFRELISLALSILQTTDSQVLAEAHFDFEQLEELAVDPRAYDHGHPTNRRPNYLFGEWDPHHIDQQGRYRRFVVRWMTLEALLQRVAEGARAGETLSVQDLHASSTGLSAPSISASPRGELLAEAAAVLAGTILMASGVSGWGPTAHDSTVTLANMIPRIARLRDNFYAGLLSRPPARTTGAGEKPRATSTPIFTASHVERLRQEVATSRQPLASARQHLNHTLARHRALQLQQRYLSIVFAEMGFPEASQREAALIPVASVRFLSEIMCRLSGGQRFLDLDQPAAAARLLPEIEGLLRRGIDCGAIVDPWNILGFQGLFPLSNAREDSIRDPRIDDLVHMVEETLHLYARLLSEAAAAGDSGLIKAVLPQMKRLAEWWDQFASSTVSDVRRVVGAEAVASAEHVAHALTRWHERGEASADLAFWRQHLQGFRTPKAFALVVDALLRKGDHRAGMALLINWLGQAEQVPLEDNAEHSFHVLALRWMMSVTKEQTSTADPSTIPSEDPWPLVKKFFDYLEANAEEFWQVPTLQIGPEQITTGPNEVEDDLFGAAYEDVTYQDSTADDQEGAVMEDGGLEKEFELEIEARRLSQRLPFISTLGRLWPLAAQRDPRWPEPDDRRDTLRQWLSEARAKQRQMLTLLDTLHDYPIPRPLGSFDSLVEYDHRRLVKEQLTYTAISTCLDLTLAVGALKGALSQEAEDDGGAAAGPKWEPVAIRLEQAIFRRDLDVVRRLLPAFVPLFRGEPLLFTTLADGGHPRQILHARLAQTVLRALTTQIPRLGLLRETYYLLKTARQMEQTQPPPERSLTEFNHLFQAAFQAVVETVVDSAASWEPAQTTDQAFVELLEKLTAPFFKLWIDHSRSLHLSSLEMVHEEHEWEVLYRFIRRYGRELFHARFLTLANLRGILHRGIGDYLDYLEENSDPAHPLRLLQDLDDSLARADVIRHMQTIMIALIENYEEYKDFNTTTTQSDYGENLHMLLDFLRLKVAYERNAWQFRPLVLVHEVLARRQRHRAGELWLEAFAHLTRPIADKHENELAKLVQKHGISLRTVADRVHERLLKPLLIDRLCAWIGPAMAEAHAGTPGPAFANLERELQQHTATPTGVGLDIPYWLRQVQMEVQRVRAEHTAIATLAEKQFRIPPVTLTLADLNRQLTDWDNPGELPHLAE
ncbi:MAG: hypothetical protein ACK4RK_13405 [Gemmataceae bacterium]